MHTVNILLHTDGSGYWSNIARPVNVIALDVPYIANDEGFGELRVHFTTDSWQVAKHGLIYTDKFFLQGLRDYLAAHGYRDVVWYSEQGMQGDDYVSFDVDAEFLAAWKANHPEQYSATFMECGGR